MPTKRTLLLIPAVAMFAFAQNPDPATEKKHEEHQSTSTKTTTSTTSRSFNGTLVDADCDVLRSHWSPSSSSSTTSAERRSSTSTEDQNTSAEGRPATDRTTTSTRESSTRTETRSSADRAEPLRPADLEACSVKSTSTSYALAMPDGNLYRLSGATLSDDINKKWSKKIANNTMKNTRVKVKGDLAGDTITVASIK